MSKTTKIIIGIIIATVIIFGGYHLFINQSGNATAVTTSTNSGGSGGFQEHFDRAVGHFGF